MTVLTILPDGRITCEGVEITGRQAREVIDAACRRQATLLAAEREYAKEHAPPVERTLRGWKQHVRRGSLKNGPRLTIHEYQVDRVTVGASAEDRGRIVTSWGHPPEGWAEHCERFAGRRTIWAKKTDVPA